MTYMYKRFKYYLLVGFFVIQNLRRFVVLKILSLILILKQWEKITSWRSSRSFLYELVNVA